MVDCGPVAPIGADGKSVIEVDRALTDEDLEWLNRHAFGNTRYERARPQRGPAPADTSWLVMTTVRG